MFMNFESKPLQGFGIQSLLFPPVKTGGYLRYVPPELLRLYFEFCVSDENKSFANEIHLACFYPTISILPSEILL
jgi:hypothetical protein